MCQMIPCSAVVKPNPACPSSAFFPLRVPGVPPGFKTPHHQWAAPFITTLLRRKVAARFAALFLTRLVENRPYGSGGDRAPGLEHKGSVDPATPLQVAKYMMNIWTRELEKTRGAGTLPMILPVVFYHGHGTWTAPLSLAEMIDAPEGIDDPLRRFPAAT